MLTKQFVKLVGAQGGGQTISMTDINGATKSFDQYAIIGYYNSDDMKIGIGTGETEPTLTDTQLESPISLTLMVHSYKHARALSDNNTIFMVTDTIKNGTASPVTIKEIGMYWFESRNSATILIARKVLNTPVTIGVEETYNFTYSIKVPS